jgi:ketosteroid isomerase-like protein
MRTMAIITLLLVGHVAISQDAQSEINNQVWKPFIKTFTQYDMEGFMALHSRDLVRCARDGNSVMNWTEYYNNTRDGELRAKMANRKRAIDLRFLERISNGNQAVETGIYKTTSFKTDGSTSDFYGKFLVVLRKENGVWKILVDTDSSEGGTISAQSFQNAKPIE